MYKVILLLVGFLLLLKSADLLVDGASSLAGRLKVSDLVIGLTVVAFGTSLPELFVNITASMKGNTDIAMGNILGSNTANILLILGISAIIFPLSVTKGTVWKEIPMALLAVVVLAVMAMDRWIGNMGLSSLTRIDGIILIIFFTMFLYYSFRIAKQVTGLTELTRKKERGVFVIISGIVVGLVGLWIASVWVVDGAVYVASILDLSQSFVGLTIVALGTSLPELATSSVAAYRKNPEIAVGNIVGSNIFNVFFILGISAIIRPIPFSPKISMDMGVVIFASLLLFFSMFTGKRRSIDRWEGVVFVLLYIGYIIFLIKRG